MGKKYYSICLLLITFLLLSGCATSPKEIKPDVEAELMSEVDEVKFGNYVDALICNEFAVLKKERLTGQVSAIGDQLVAHSLRTDLEFKFRILNTETVNAFAGPGGFVYITVGLLDELESKDQLAAVLSHEIGHCCARHSIKSWKTAQKISRTLSIVDIAAIIAGLPPVAGAGGDIIAGIGQRAAQLASFIIYQNYSRGYEYQADELGLQQMHKAGYDPEAMIQVLKKFVDLRKDEGREKGMVILSSHPHLEDRIEHAREYINQFKTGY